MVRPVDIAGRMIGPGQRCFIIAEAGVNHNGEVALAKRLIEAAADAGADAVKFQTFRADRLVSRSAPKAAYQRGTTDPEESQFEMIRRLELSPGAHRDLQGACRRCGVLFLSTPFDEDSVALLEELGVPAFKISSGDVTNWPLLSYVARRGRPVILSTGMSDLEEVADAVRTIRGAGNGRLILMHCVSQYPADPAEANLRAMQTLAGSFAVPVGFSDHTRGTEVALAAVALGACVVEKHLTLDRRLAGPDHRASSDPGEFRTLVRGIRAVEAALGDGRKRPMPGERDTALAARRSLIAAQDIPAGTPLTDALIAIQRPGGGLPPSARARLLGRKVKVDLRGGTVLTWDVLV